MLPVHLKPIPALAACAFAAKWHATLHPGHLSMSIKVPCCAHFLRSCKVPWSPKLVNIAPTDFLIPLPTKHSVVELF